MARLLLRDLIPGTTYKLQLRANDGDSVSEWSRKFDLPVITDSNAPKVPANVSFIVDGTDYLGQWDSVTQNTDNSPATILKYEMQLRKGTTVKNFSMTSNEDEAVQERAWDYAKIQALFGKSTQTLDFRVRAVNTIRLSSTWSAWNTATILSGPEAPSNVVVTGTTDGLKITWDAPGTVSNIAGYRVYVSTAGSGFVPSPANMIYDGLALSCVYNTATYALHYVKVRSYDYFGKESSDATGSGTPVNPFLVDVTPPVVPVINTGSSSLTNNANGIGAYATLVWTQTVPTPDDLSAFDIRFRKVGDTVWTNTGRVDKADRSAVIPVPLAYTNYEFQVRSLDYSTNTAGWSSTATLTGQPNVAPGNVSTMTALAGNDSITYTWAGTSDTDLKNYEVTFSTNSAFTGTAPATVTYLTGSSTTLTVGGLAYATPYYARVRAVDNGGLTSSSWSATNTTPTLGSPSSDGVVPAVPSAPTVAAGPAGSLYVTWPAVTTNSLGAASTDTVTYEVHLSATTGFTPVTGTKVTEVSGTSALIDALPGTTTPLTYGTTYFVKLVAKDRDGIQTTPSAQGSGAPSKIVSGDVTSIGADLIVPGTGFVSALVINTGGSIQSGNYNPATPAGWKIGTAGAEFLDSGSTVSAAAIKAGTLGGSGGSGVIQIAAGTSLIFNGGYLKSNTYTGTSQATNPSGNGFYLGNDGIRIDQGIVSASALTAGTISGTNTITLSGANAKIVGPGFTLSGSGLTVTGGYIDAGTISITNVFANSTVAATTYIDGGKINTGTIQSNQYTSVGGTSQPLWSISLTGAATFADASVRGKLVVGPAGSTDNSYIQSGNYSPGNYGWKIDAQGNAYFMSATVQGTVTSSSILNDQVEIGASYVRATSASNRAGSYVQLDSSNYQGVGTFYPAVSFSQGSSISGVGSQIHFNPAQAANPAFSTSRSGNDSYFALDMHSNNIANVGTISGPATLSGGPSFTGGTKVASGDFTMQGTSGQLTVASLGSSPAGSNNSATGPMYCRVGASGVLWSSVTAPSSRRLKKNIKSLDIDYKQILKLKAHTYEYKEMPDYARVGFIAEEAHDLGLNIFVGYEDSNDPTRPSGFDYDGFDAGLLLVDQGQQAEIDALRKELDELKTLVEKLVR